MSTRPFLHRLHPAAPRLDASRRLFLRHAGVLSAVAGAGAPMALNLLAAGSAAAQTATDYKAVVCLFLFGGNDAYNMVLPTDAASWQAYATTRNQAPDSIALLAPGVAPLAGAAVGSPARLGGRAADHPAQRAGPHVCAAPADG